MVKIIDTLLGKSSASADEDYMELDLTSYEEHGGAAPALLVKIATIADLDGDGSPEIVASSGYEVFVFSSRDARLMMRDYVGFPASAGAPGNIYTFAQLMSGGGTMPV